MKLPPFNNTYCHIALIAAFALAAMSPILLYGTTGGADFKQHYQFALTFYDAIQHGQVYPGWAALPNFGFGDVGIRFYPPLSYYVLVLFRWISGNWFTASYLAFGFWFFLGGLGIYLWARQWFTANAALVAALVYTFAPYHVNEIYNAFTYAEFAAAGIIPFCFLFVDRIIRNRGSLNVIGLAVAYAVLVLTHIPMTIMGSISLLVYSLASLSSEIFSAASFRKCIVPKIAKLAFGVMVGLLISSFYWIRMVTELASVNHSGIRFASNEYDFRFNFLASYFSVTEKIYYERSLGHCDAMLLITFEMSVMGLAIYFFGRKWSFRDARFTHIILFGLSFFFSTWLSMFVWERVDILQKIQFPWRWLAIMSLACALLAASAFDYVSERESSKPRPLALVCAVLLLTGILLTATEIIMPAALTDRASFEHQLEGLESARSYNCWWPVWARENAFKEREPVSAPERSIAVVGWEAESRHFTVEEGPAENVRVAVFYYPRWTATVNGQPVPIDKDSDGAILIPVPANRSDVQLNFEEPYYIRAATFISLAALLGIGIAFLAMFRKSAVNLRTL